ncbi:MAG: LysR family transcriptional regulator [Polyangiaceae bacterium]|nr:LysR family transcriptional regulator [Polyangiaceae bacterium]
MDIDALRVFVKVAELSSFTRAADQLKMPKSRVSMRVSELEAQLGSRLFQRSTRVVRLTPDGEILLPRARRLLDEAQDLETMFQAPSGLRGTVRVDLPINLARDFVIPKLPDLLTLHPQLEVVLSTTDRRVDVVREGFDCVLSVGNLKDSGLVTRRLGVLTLANCVSAAYAAKRGAPRAIEDLDDHLVVHYSLRLGRETPTFEYIDDGRLREKPMKSLVTVNNADAYRAACLAGLGIIQAPRLGLEPSIASGLLVEVLPQYVAAPMPVSLVHPHGSSVPRRVRAVMAWLAQQITPRLG